MANKYQVLNYFDQHPDATSGDCARALGCDSAYVRATLKRANRELAKKWQRTPEQLRQHAARLIKRAEEMEAQQNA